MSFKVIIEYQKFNKKSSFLYIKSLILLILIEMNYEKL